MTALSRIALIVCATLSPATFLPAMAQDATSLADLASDSKMGAAFTQMAKDHKIPAWVSEAAVVSPAQSVGFDDKEWLAMSACEAHNCAAQQIAVIYAPDSGKMYGVLSQTEETSGAQALDWLNIGGGAESIDGRTILFAALSGSLANHPSSFDYNGH